MVITKVIPEKEYQVTVMGVSSEGECLERGMVQVHLLEKVTGVATSDTTTNGFKVKWNVRSYIFAHNTNLCKNTCKMHGFKVKII